MLEKQASHNKTTATTIINNSQKNGEKERTKKNQYAVRERTRCIMSHAFRILHHAAIWISTSNKRRLKRDKNLKSIVFVCVFVIIEFCDVCGYSFIPIQCNFYRHFSVSASIFLSQSCFGLSVFVSIFIEFLQRTNNFIKFVNAFTVDRFLFVLKPFDTRLFYQLQPITCRLGHKFIVESD